MLEKAQSHFIPFSTSTISTFCLELSNCDITDFFRGVIEAFAVLECYVA
jgi:hypothetical protein